MSARQILDNIIKEFSPEKFTAFFREKTRRYTPLNESFSDYNDDNFKDGIKLGELSFPEDKDLLVSAFRMPENLTERSGKKAQYEKAKKILKDNQKYSSGIFIFHDPTGNFRFSLVYEEPAGIRRNWSSFRRFTYFVSSELTNKTFLQRVGEGDFSNLKSIREAFSVEKVTKEFYQAIANWYFWAVDSCKFPEGAEEETNGRQMAVIRMITRLIFVWFMRERNLIPRELFKKENIAAILKNLSTGESTYYKAVLQNLFFATLSTRREERKFRTGHRYKGRNNDFGNQYVYRYHSFFKDPEKLKDYFDGIPFLNGGLFECLDSGRHNKYIDGFTERKNFQPEVPNFLFFSPEEKADLNRHYGTSNKNYLVRGILDILSSYNFTIDENSPYDADVALDPELLGRVFENLLASFNPETSTTARKSTGSYYTPREIVDFMVDESLKAYFKTHLENIDDKLENLFDVSNEENPLSEKESGKLVDLIENVRIVDPAVGSGAFPMGALNKLVSILNKIDPGNKKWKEAQLKAADSIPDPSVRKEAKEKIEDFFSRKNIDYLRKLYLIQRCIYGVDIQQIAVEIAKLRFFISLLVDERVEDEKENSGIEPLPNLEFKIMQGNSLVEILTPELLTSRTDREKMKLLDGLKSAKEEFFELSNPNDKIPKREAIEGLLEKIIEHERYEAIKGQKGRIQIIEHDIGEGLFADRVRERNKNKKIAQIKEKIKEIEYSKNFAPDRHFEWQINFSEVFEEKGGFDVVIGNPPYIQLQKLKGQTIQEVYKKQNYNVYDSNGDIYCLFYEKGIDILRETGHLAYITSNKWMRAGYGEKLRKYFSEYNPVSLIDLGPGVFESATVDTNILLLQKAENRENLFGVTISNINSDKPDIGAFLKEHGYRIKDTGKDAWFIGSDAENRLKQKIEEIGKPLKEWDVKINYGIKTGLNEAFIIDTPTRDRLVNEDPKSAEILKPVLRGRDIKRYSYDWAGLWVIATGFDINIPDKYPAVYRYLLQFKEKAMKRDDQGKNWWNLRACAYYPEFEKEKVVWQEMSQEPNFAYDTQGMFACDTGRILTGGNIKFFVGFLNSTLFDYVFSNYYAGGGLGEKGIRYKSEFMKYFPIPVIKSKNQSIVNDIEGLVEEILTRRKEEKTADTKELEIEIDQLVYQLYELTPEEIGVVEGKG